MDNNLVKQVESARTLSRKAKLLLVTILAAATATGALALFQPSPPPVSSPAAVSNADVPQVPLARERAEDHQYLSERSALAAALVAATLRQEELKDRWLERAGCAPIEVAAPTERKMFEEHSIGTTAQQNGAAAATLFVRSITRTQMFEQHRACLAQQGMRPPPRHASEEEASRRNADMFRQHQYLAQLGGEAAAASRRQQELKDAWLERGRTAGPAEVFPDARPAGVSTGNQRLLDLNNRFSPDEAVPARNASWHGRARLLDLNNQGCLRRTASRTIIGRRVMRDCWS